MKKFKFLIAFVMLLTIIGIMCVNAYSSTDKIAKMCKEASWSNLEYWYLKMQATYNDAVRPSDYYVIR